MALTLRTNGNNPINIVSASWWNDYYNLLTGVMTDQPVTLNYRPASSTSTPTLELETNGNAPLLSGLNSVGAQAFFVDANGCIHSVSNGTVFDTTSNTAVVGIEHGSASVASGPFFDWHSSGNAIDYDARIQATGGNATIGQGLLHYFAAGGHFFDSSVQATTVVAGPNQPTNTLALAAKATNAQGNRVVYFANSATSGQNADIMDISRVTNQPQTFTFGINSNDTFYIFDVDAGAYVLQGAWGSAANANAGRIPTLRTNGGGAGGQVIWVGTTDPGANASEGDIWIDA